MTSRIRPLLLSSMLIALAGCSSHHPLSEAKPPQPFGDLLRVPDPNMVRIRKCTDGREWVKIDQSLAAGRRITIWDASNGTLVSESDKKNGLECLCLTFGSTTTWGDEPALPAGCADWVRDDSELDRLRTRFPKP